MYRKVLAGLFLVFVSVFALSAQSDEWYWNQPISKIDFNGLKNVSKGDVVKISTSYGNYKYTVTGTKLTTDEDKSAYDLNSKKENLILYTCYPFDSIGLTNKRFFVYAEKTSGPTITGLYE
jgi:sortase (surface protein transpeptidase)